MPLEVPPTPDPADIARCCGCMRLLDRDGDDVFGCTAWHVGHDCPHDFCMSCFESAPHGLCADCLAVPGRKAKLLAHWAKEESPDGNPTE